MRRVGVVVPAKNEEASIAVCLRALLASADALAQARPEIEVRIVCVADDCADATERIARDLAAEDARVRVLAVEFGTVGRTRRAGCEEILGWAGRDPQRLWMATTDADSLVPPAWLRWQVETAEEGWDLLVGTVVPDERGVPGEQGPPAELIARWHELHDLTDGHACVFGANLGFRASAYLAAGGFAPLSSGEDVRLVEDIAATGARVARLDGERVLTSARRHGRVLDGFSTYLRDLETESAQTAAQAPASS